MDHIRAAEPSDAPAIETFIAGISAARGVPALTEYKMRALRGNVPGVGVCGFSGPDLVGYVQAAYHTSPAADQAGHWALEAVVGFDSITAAPRLLQETASDLRNGETLAWASDPMIEAELEEAGFREVRRIYRMSVALPLEMAAPLPAGITLGRFVVCRDEASWIETNNRAFAGHPENGAVTMGELRDRMELEWFSAEDVLMAWSGESLAGSCWTKVHEGRLGEIYIIGVDPEAEGMGLGRALVFAAARHLHRERMCSRLMLFTDAANVRALHLYESVGFQTDLVNRQFAFPD